jgi:hypothetical protein
MALSIQLNWNIGLVMYNTFFGIRRKESFDVWKN